MVRIIKTIQTIKDRCRVCEHIIIKDITLTYFKTRKPTLDLKMQCNCIKRTITLEDPDYIPLSLARWNEEAGK